MNQDQELFLVPEAIGTPFEGGFYGGKIRIGLTVFDIIWAPKAQGEINGNWLPKYASVPGAASCYDSMANTKAMAEAGSSIAKAALAADINGFRDWCVPARDVLEMGYRGLKPTNRKNHCSFRDGDNASSLPPGYLYTPDEPAQTAATNFQIAGSEAFDEAWYWSSTQSGENHAFYQSFGSGGQYYTGKSCLGRCRFVRLIQLDS